MSDIKGSAIIGIFVTVLIFSFFSPVTILWIVLSPVGFWQIFFIVLLGIVLGFVLVAVFFAVLSTIFN